MKTIIAATDFSPCSRNASKYAAALARTLDARLLLVNVVRLPAPVSEIPVDESLAHLGIEASKSQLLSLKNDLQQTFDKTIPIDIKADSGSVSELLSQEVLNSGAFAIVLGTDQLTWFDHLLLENEALNAIRTVSRPVFLIPAGTNFKPIRKVAIATDLDDSIDLSALHSLKEILNILKPYLEIIHVSRRKDVKKEKLIGSIGLQKELEQFNPEFRFLTGTNFKSGIDAYIHQKQPDLLVTFPGQLDIADRLFHKSKSKQIINQPQIPILSILNERRNKQQVSIAQ